MKLLYPCKSRRVTSPFGKRKIGDGFHDGIDFGATVRGVDGDEIYAAHDGIVAKSYVSGSYGECIIINSSDNKFSTIYGHMSKRVVKLGEKIYAGQIIGYMGNTGQSSGTHLHFEVRTIPFLSSNTRFFSSVDGKFPSSVDPALYLVEKEVNNVKIENKVQPVSSASASKDSQHEPSSWAKESWEKAIKMKIVDGKNPKSALTREQLTIVLDRLGLLD